MQFDTPQQLFDHVVNTLRKQGGPSHSPARFPDSNVTCLYRSPKGRRCAAGACIPDDIYSSKWEGSHILPLIKHNSCLSYLIGYENLIMALQIAHDDPVLTGPGLPLPSDSEWLMKFEDKAEKLAAYFGLAYTPSRPL